MKSDETAGASDFTEAQNRAITATIREQLALKRLSRQRLADDAKIGLSTLEKSLQGTRPFTLATVVRLEQVLGVSLRDWNSDPHATAPEELGAYSRMGVRWLEGDYLTLRPSFEVADTIFAFRTEILWDDAASCLRFREAERLDAVFSQKGVVSVPVSTGHVYLHTNEHGQMRLAILGRPSITGQMYGLLTTLQVGSGSQLVPVSVPLALIPISGAEIFGRIPPTHPAHTEYSAHLDRVIKEHFVRFPKLDDRK